MFPFELEDTTYSEMRDSGGVALIDDEGLRKQLADYYRLSGTGITAMILHHDPMYRAQIRGLTPWRVQQYIWSTCFQEGAAANGADEKLIDCPSPISEDEAAAILDSYRRSDTLLPNLRTWMSTLRVSRLVLESTGRQTNRLTAEVQAARER